MTIDHVPAILILSMVIPLTSEGCSPTVQNEMFLVPVSTVRSFRNVSYTDSALSAFPIEKISNLPIIISIGHVILTGSNLYSQR